MTFLATIWHTGTHRATAHLAARGDTVEHRHVDRPLAAEFDRGEIATPDYVTYRNPHLVAASWVNRYPLKEIEDNWEIQWDTWAKMVDAGAGIIQVEKLGDPVMKSSPDKTGAKRAYLDGHMEKYFRIVPEHLINYALNCVGVPE